jgi:hypothetical protein
VSSNEINLVRPVKQLDVINKDVHPQAQKLIEQLTLDFGTAILLQAKTLAHRRNDDVVLRTHVDEALDIIQQERRQRRWKDWAVAIGGALFGTFAQGFITELSAGRNPIFLGIYVLLGFVGLLLMFAGFQKS